LARKPQKKKADRQPEEEIFYDYGLWGDLWRYFKLTVSLAFNFGFAVFVGYVLGEMADDTFLGAYDTVFTYVGLGLGFIGALFGTHKRIVRFSKRQEDLFLRRYRGEGPERYKPTVLGIGFLALFAGLSRLCGLIYLAELREAGTLWYLWLDLVLAGGGLLAVGVLVLLRRWSGVKIIRWLFLVPIALGAPIVLLSLAGGARPNVAVALMLMVLAPLVGMFVAFFEGEKKAPAA
jgi:hypothetical protein